MSEMEAVKAGAFLDYLERRMKAKRREYAEPGTSERSRDILETEIAELRVIRREFKEHFLGEYCRD